jgi:hypothetical protein
MFFAYSVLMLSLFRFFLGPIIWDNFNDEDKLQIYEVF